VTRGTLVLTVVGYLAGVFRILPPDLLAAVPPAIFPGFQLWRLLTYPLVVLGIWNVLFGLLLLWSFGTELEMQWGSVGYALFLAIATFTAGVLGTATALLVRTGGLDAGFGLAGLLTALIVAWTLMGPNLPTNLFGVLPMNRKGFAILAIVIVVFGEIEQTRSLARLVFVLGGIPAAWFWVRGRGGRGFRISMRPPRFLRRRRFRVIRDEDSHRFH
jgi:membrane associated rhomboid family serine protease